MRIKRSKNVWLASLMVASLSTGAECFGVSPPARPAFLTPPRSQLQREAVPADARILFNFEDNLPKEDTEKKLGIAIGRRLVQLTPEEDEKFTSETRASISSIIDAGLKEMELLKDRLKRDNLNPHDHGRLKWNREYYKEELALRAKVDGLAFNFLKDSDAERRYVHRAALEQSIMKEFFVRKADAASHGRPFVASENSIVGAKLIIRARKALQGLMPNQGTWNEWDEWTRDEADENDDNY